MTAGRWTEVKAVLAAVLEAEPGERERTLSHLCPDPELRREVESLLAVEDRAEAVLQTSAAPGAILRAELSSVPPESIGAYKIVRELGRGGMGVVYLGERADGEFRKQVAIKLITTGRFDPGLQKRFRRERQILARFEHPGIARFIDGGATAEGQPYFVMEYVEGQPLLEYCESHALSIPQKLDLFLSICDTVAHAHGSLIVHRDLKPSNILVDAAGHPKLLDFGLARVLDSETSPENTDERLTQAGVPILTPAYASPEQVRGEPFAVSGDVYSLGVILFELLSGRRPYDVSNASVLEMMRIVCEREPLALSAASDDLALKRKLRGDLESIAAKALEKDPRRRYQGVSEFSADLRRYLDGQPVRARNATFAYRAGKLLRRHRVAIPSTALAAILILTFAGVAIFEAIRSERRFQEVRSLAHSVMFDLHDAIAPLPGSTKARALLVSSALDYLERLSRESGNDPRLAREIALGYKRVGTVQGYSPESNLGNSKAALESFKKSGAIFEKLTARDPADLTLRHEYISVLQQLGDAYSTARDWASATASVQKMISLAQQSYAANTDSSAAYDLAMAQTQLADLATDQGQYAEAIPIREKALLLFQQLSDAEPSNLERKRSAALAHKKLAALYGVTQRYAESHRQYELARVLDEARCAADPTNLRARMDLSYDYSDLGWVTSRMNDDRGALEWHQKALAIREEAFKADPNDRRAQDSIASTTGRIAHIYMRLGDLDPALAQSQKALELWKARAAQPGAPVSVTEEVADAHADVGETLALLAAKQSNNRYCARSAAEYQQASALYAALRDRGVLPKASYAKIDDYAHRATTCGKQ